MTDPEIFYDFQLPPPAEQFITLFTRVATGLCLVYFSISELTYELREYRKLKGRHG